MSLKKFFLTGILLLLLLLTCACNAKEEKNSGPIDIYELNQSGILTPLSQVQFYEEDEEQQYWSNMSNRMTKCNGGYYVASSGYTGTSGMCLGYVDSDMNQCTPMCSDSLCNHKNSNCNAFYDDYEAQIWSYKNKLYAIKRESGRTHLVEIDVDGNNRKTLFEIGYIPLTENDSTTLTFYDNCVYSYDRLLYVLGVNKSPNYIRKRSLDGKTDEYVITSSEDGCGYNKVRSYNGNLFFTYHSYVYRENELVFNSRGLYCYDIKKHELYRLLDDNVIDYALDTENNKVYCFIDKEGLYEYDFKTGDRKKIYEAGEDTFTCTVSYDGNYIYMDNHWSLFAMAGSDSYKEHHRAIVLDKTGKIVNEICNIDMSNVILFGDEDYMFQYGWAEFKTDHHTDDKPGNLTDFSEYAYFGSSYIKKSEIATAKEFTKILWP